MRILVFLFMCLIPVVCIGDAHRGSISFDVGLIGISDRVFRKAAMIAFIRRDWSLEFAAPQKIIGSHEVDGDIEIDKVNVEITYESNIVTIQYSHYYDGHNNIAWLKNLKKDFLVALIQFS